MTIKSIYLRNFMNIAEADLEFQLGTNVLAGDFGQGKSAIFEAIAFCLLKDHKKGPTWEEYLRRGYDDGEIRLTIQMSDDPDDLMSFKYTMVRNHDVSKMVSYHDSRYDSNSLVNAFLSKALDQEMLKNITFLMQGGPTINDMTDAQRRDIFKKIFNSEFPLVLAAIEKDFDLWTESQTAKKIQIEGLKTKQYNFQRIIEVDATELEEVRTELRTAQGFLSEEQRYQLFLAKKKELADKQKHHQDLGTEKGIHEVTITTLNAEIIKLDTQKKDSALAVSDSNKLLEGHYTINVTMQSTAVDLLKAALAGWEKDSPVSVKRQTIQTLQTEIADARAKQSVIRIHKETHEKGECTQCGQPTDKGKIPEMETELAGLKLSIDAKTKEMSEVNQEILDFQEKLKKQSVDIAAATATLNATILERTKEEAKLAAKQKEIKGFEERIEEIRAKRITSEETQITSLQARMQSLDLEITQMEKWIIENEMEIPVSSGRPVGEVQTELDSLISQIASNLEKTKTNLALTAEQATDKETMLQYIEDLNGIQLKLKRLKVVRKNWEVEFPNFINLTGCEVLSEQMNKFFEANRKGFEVKLTNSKKGIAFTYKVGDLDTYGPAVMTSGFEGAMLTLSFKVAVARASAAPLVFLDEPDAAAGGVASVKVFETILNLGAFKQQFVITHKPEAIDFLKENGALIYYVKEGAFSTYAQ